jgi:DNA-binding response OmpR family regulator
MLAQAHDAGAAFPLVLLDAMRTEMDGFTLAAQIKKDPMLAETTIQCLAAGMDAYIAKPIRPDDLYTAIDQRLQGELGHPWSAATPQGNGELCMNNGKWLKKFHSPFSTFHCPLVPCPSLLPNDGRILPDVKASAYQEKSL